VRIEHDFFGIHVFLSRRNLESLLAKLDGSPGGSFRTIEGPSMYERFAVSGEEDEEHYAHPSRQEMIGIAGRMHGDTETVMGAPRVALEGEDFGSSGD
jgi:hypothetical protein